MADRAVGVPFAKEGIPFIAVPAGVTLLTGWLGWPVIACVGAVATVSFRLVFQESGSADTARPKACGGSWRWESDRYRGRVRAPLSERA